MKFQILIFLLLMCLFANSQSRYTIYDDVPGNSKSYKPSLQEDFPSWAKMMYDNNINYYEIKSAYEKWESLGTNDFRAIRRYYINWSKNIEPWVSKDGQIKLPDLEQYQNNMYKNQKASSNINRGKLEWSFLGPKETFWLNESGSSTTPLSAPWQVNIYSFDVAMSNQNVLYCGTETGYMNKSIDKGETWFQSGLTYNFGGGIKAIAIDPENENVIYASAGNQMHKSTDGGSIWIPLLNSGDNFNADRIEIDKSNSDKIYAATNTGIFISKDAGLTWSSNFNSPIYDVHRHPTNTNVVYALARENDNFRLMVSEDGGDTFLNDISFPQNISDESGGLLAVSNDSPNSIFVVMLSANNTPILYEGDFISKSWNLLATGQSTELDMNNWQGYYDLVFEVSDEDARIIYTGTASLYKSINGGNSFLNIGGYGGSFELHPDIQDMKILDNDEIWVSTDGGLNYSNDNFSTHQVAKINGIIGSDMWGFDQSWNEDLIVGGRYHNGNMSIADFYGDKALRMGGAESPTGWVRQGKSRHVAFDDLGAGWILPPTPEGQPEGRFLFSKFPNMDEYGGRRSNMVFHPNYFGTIYIGEENSLWKSEDSGMSYDLIYDFGRRVRWLQISYSNPNVMYADLVGLGLMKSEDGGVSWNLQPTLTNAPNGNGSWSGRLFFAISPTDENKIYACLQNGTWSSDIGKIFKSIDGGDSWENWTGSISEYTKNLVIQPGENGEDLVYLFTNARDKNAKVFLRSENADQWEDCSNGFPAGFQVNLALPFFRDGKIRVSGNGGIWESMLSEQSFAPIINPWVEKSNYYCLTDTIYFEDHSIINHEGCAWRWEISPTPDYISDINVRNPAVVLGSVGSYDVTMHINKNGVEYSKTIPNMISTTECPSIEDCSNPAELPKSNWELVYVDSEEPNAPGLATMAFDDDPATIWHTRWTSGNDQYPHEMIVDLGDTYFVHNFTYLPRQNGQNGRVKAYELYISEDASNWGTPASIGEFDNSFSPSTIKFDDPVMGKYFKLICLSEVNGNIWSSAAELSIKGCLANEVSTHNETFENLMAFPIPSNGIVQLDIPIAETFQLSILNSSGQEIEQRVIKDGIYESISIDLSSYSNGIYILRLQSKSGINYTAKVVKI